jgi:AAA+ ATPase superfamily predicted ATPase
MTEEELKKQREVILGVLDKKLQDIKNQLKAEHDRKKEDNYDFKEREKELNEHLDTMT